MNALIIDNILRETFPVQSSRNISFYACLMYYMVLIITYQKFRKISALESDLNHTLINAPTRWFRDTQNLFKGNMHYL